MCVCVCWSERAHVRACACPLWNIPCAHRISMAPHFFFFSLLLLINHETYWLYTFILSRQRGKKKRKKVPPRIFLLSSCRGIFNVWRDKTLTFPSHSTPKDVAFHRLAHYLGCQTKSCNLQFPDSAQHFLNSRHQLPLHLHLVLLLLHIQAKQVFVLDWLPETLDTRFSWRDQLDVRLSRTSVICKG